VVVVAPFGEMVCKLQAGRVRICVLKINDDKLLVSIGWKEKRRGA